MPRNVNNELFDFVSFKEMFEGVCKDFNNGLITEAVFKAYLYSLDFNSRERRAETEFHRPKPKKDGE